jgi:Short C-terminal domain
MDKLELDDRVSRLEHRVSVVTALILTVLLLFGISAAFFLVARSEVRLSPPMAAPTMVSEITAIADPPAMQLVKTTKDLDAEIRKADGLRSGGLINPEDFAAKKALILAQPLQVYDFKEEMEVAKKLKDAGMVDPEEYEILKKKILGTGK